MKKLVTIRKARKGEKPGFVNKTAKFLKKAEMGTEVQSGSGEYNEKILEYVAEQILEQGQDAESVYKTLIESKIEPEVAAEHVQAILNFQQNMQQEEAAQVTDETAGEEAAYAQAANEVEEDLASDYGYYDSSGQGTQLAADDEEEEESNAYDDQMVTDIVNNEWTGQDGGVIDQYIVNNYLPVTGDLSQDDYNAFNYKTGGKVSKRTFMKNVMSELKKAREGMEQEAQQSPEQKFDTTDTLLLDRNKKKDNFVTALSKTTQEAKDKEKAEQMWQQQQMMMQQPQMQMDPSIPMLNRQAGGPAMEADPTEYTHYTHGENDIFHDQMNTMLTARGGMAMPSPREYRKMHRQVSRMLPNLYLDPNIKASELDVRKTGMFGRPKQYSIKFQGNQGITPGWAHGTLLLGLPGGANMMPNVYNPFGMFGSASSYGGGYTKGIVETKKVLDTGRMRPVSRTPNQPGVSYVGYSDNPAPAGTTIGTDAQGNRIAMAPAGSGTIPENETWQNYSPTIVPGVNPIVAPNFDMNSTQYGGFVDPSNPELYKFIYGGGDNMFEDDMNTINTADPYFGRMYSNGGLIKAAPGYNITNPEKIVSTPPNQYQSPAYQQFNPNATSGSNYAAFLELQKRGLAQGSYDPGKSYDISNTNPGTTTNTTTTTQQRPTTTSNQVVTNFSNIPGYRSNGLIDTLFSANVMPQYLGTWSKIKDVRTANGQPFTGFNANTVLNEIDVRRSGMRGQPKAYTMKFNQYTDPRDANKITLNPMENRINDPNDPSKLNVRGKENSDKALQPRGTYRDLGLFDQMKIRANERWADRRSSYEPDVNPENEPLSNEEMLKSQGKIWDEQQKKWVTKTTPSSSSFPGYLNRPDASQAVSQNPVTFQSPKSVWDPNNIVPNTSASNAPQSNLGPVGMTSSQPVAQPLGSAAGPMTQEQAAQAAFASPENDPMANGQDPRNGFGSSNPTNVNNSNTTNTNFIDKPEDVNNISQPTETKPVENNNSTTFKPSWSVSLNSSNMPQQEFCYGEKCFEYAGGSKGSQIQEAVAMNSLATALEDYDPKNFSNLTIDELKTIIKNKKGRAFYGDDDKVNKLVNTPEGERFLNKWLEFQKERLPYFDNPSFKSTDLNNPYYTSLTDPSGKGHEVSNVYSDFLSRYGRFKSGDNPNSIRSAIGPLDENYENYQSGGFMDSNNPDLYKFVYSSPTRFDQGGVSYTNNPAFVGKSNIDLLSENSDVAVPNLQPSSFWADSQSFNKPQPTPFDNCTEDQKKDPNSPCYEGYTIDPNQQISDTLKKDMMDSNEVEIDVKNKNVYGVDLEADLAVANKFVSIAPAIQNRREANKLLGNKKLKKPSDAQYANNPAGDPWQSKGQTSISGSTYGLFDPRNAGQINYSGRSQYGGSIYKEGGVAYMSADELQKFMEEGGEIEFI